MDEQKLKAAIVKNGYTLKEIALKLGMSPSTLRRKLRDDSLGLVEAKILIKLLEIDDPASVFFKQKVT